MGGGIGFVQHAKLAYRSNRALLSKRGSGFEKMSENTTIHSNPTKYNFKKADKKALNKIRESAIRENRKDLIKRIIYTTTIPGLLFLGLFILG